MKMKFAVGVVVVLFSVGAFSVPVQRDNGINFNMDQEWYMIPQKDSSLKLMSREQIISYLQRQKRFDPDLDTKMVLYTRANSAGTLVNMGDSDALAAGGFNAADPVRLTIHGWNGDATSGVNAVSQYLEAGNFNHFVVDWSAGAGTLDYIAARNRVPTTAQFLGRYIQFLISHGSSNSRIYTVGHSLGGQMAGLTGQYLDPSVGQLAACICLDPAGPLFSNDDPDDRASPDDCAYVEGIHTNGWILGIGYPVGDSDFYPNGGKSQPGCGIDLVGTCAHGRAPEFFQESLVTGLPFIANHCNGNLDDVTGNNCQPSGGSSQMMGDPVNYSARGLFHLTTSDSSPFVLPLFKK